MRTYTLKGKGKQPDVSFTTEDLIPIKQKWKFSWDQLCAEIDYSNFQPLLEDFSKDYVALYNKIENKGVDLFLIRGTDVIVIPGNHMFPTTLKKEDIVTV
jgi:hypothetical protein